MESTTTPSPPVAAAEGGWYGKIAADYLAAKGANPSLTKASYCRENGLSLSTLNTALWHAKAPKRRADLPGQTNWLDGLDGEEATS